MEIELLIALVEMRPVLWDSSCEIYKDRKLKDDAWLEVCCGLFEDFYLLNESEKKNTVIGVISKWRTVRDNYIRSLKKLNQSLESGSTAKHESRYKYHDQLMFLDKLKCERKTESSIVQLPPDGTTEHAYTSAVEESEKDLDCAKSVYEPPRKKKAYIKSNVLLSNIEKKLVKFMDSHEKCNFKKDETENDDFNFLKSLLPTMKKLSPAKKIDFRIEVMQLLKTMINTTANTPSRS